jgi:hypothetical protein
LSQSKEKVENGLREGEDGMFWKVRSLPKRKKERKTRKTAGEPETLEPLRNLEILTDSVVSNSYYVIR